MTQTQATLAFHPAADIFPLLEGEDFDALVEDIRENGQRLPILTLEGQILDGRNRYRACRALGIDPLIEEWDGDDALDFVISVNLHRRHLTVGQRAMVAINIANMGEGRPPDNTAHFCAVSQQEAATRLHVSRRTVQQAAKVIERAEPEVVKAVTEGKISLNAAEAIADLPRGDQAELVTGDESEIFAKIRQKNTAKRREKRLAIVVAQAQPLDAIGRYPVLLADPPWQYQFSETENRAIENQYPTLALGELMDLPVRDLATDDALLFLWTTPPKAGEAIHLLEAWGFDYVSQWIWVKDKIGMGYWGRAQHELVYVCRRGNFPTPEPELRPPSVFNAARTAHSEKPSEVHERIERMFPGVPKIELFARRPRAGWALWGNQAPKGTAV